MITKVVLGVALVLIEFSAIIRSQNNSLSANNETSHTTTNISNFSSFETTLSDFPAAENTPASITNSDTSTTIKLITISNFATTLSPDTSTKQKHETITAATSAASTPIDFQLPENCSAYKVSCLAITKCYYNLSSYIFHFKLLNDQPRATPFATIKKCCPLNQHYKYDFGKRSCANSTYAFKVNAIQAKFYENCIEDEEINVSISIVTENNCKK
jgi:hypothetical protein